jgi:large subunit ribosomal protein L18
MGNSKARQNRKERIRKKIAGTGERPRLSVYKSLRHMVAQVIDDSTGRTLVFVSTQAKDMKTDVTLKSKKDAAKRVGLLVAENCKKAKIEKVVFDRNGFPYHGRVAAVADGAREGGLQF